VLIESGWHGSQPHAIPLAPGPPGRAAPGRAPSAGLCRIDAVTPARADDWPSPPESLTAGRPGCYRPGQGTMHARPGTPAAPPGNGPDSAEAGAAMDRLRATAACRLREHVDNGGTCARCHLIWPCETASSFHLGGSLLRTWASNAFQSRFRGWVASYSSRSPLRAKIPARSCKGGS
jgi:hypothetical protein